MIKALEFFDEKKIFHNDINPRNIIACLKENEWIFKIIDFDNAIILKTDENYDSS